MDTSDTQKTPQGRTGKRLPACLSRFARDGKGSVAVEFAALAIPFSLLVFAVLESCISFAAQQVLTNATDDVARQFRTGQIKPSDVQKNHNLVRDKICERLEIMVSPGCLGLLVDLKRYDSFAAVAAQRIKYTPGGDIDASGFSIEPGLSLSKNQLRVFYRWPVMTDFLRKTMSNLPDGKTLHFASVTWQNEPFDD
jgi:Flp pilus assembly protein TadG